jgi:hypothetical protein
MNGVPPDSWSVDGGAVTLSQVAHSIEATCSDQVLCEPSAQRRIAL